MEMTASENKTNIVGASLSNQPRVFADAYLCEGKENMYLLFVPTIRVPGCATLQEDA